MTQFRSVDFSNIVAHAGDQRAAFEEFCTQLARHVDVPAGATFQRNGRGADLGVECIWQLPDGTAWGWQAKFVFDIDGLKTQVDESFASALAGHPNLTRYYLCFPFQPSDARGRGKSQHDKLKQYTVDWQTLAANKGRTVAIEPWPAAELTDRLLQIDEHGGRRLYWFGDPVLTPDWFGQHIAASLKMAEPRYTPALTVKHPVSRVLHALGTTKEWGHRLEEWRAKLAKRREDWARSIAAASSSETPEFPATLFPASNLLLDTVEQLVAGCAKDPRELQWTELQRLTVEALNAHAPLEEALRTALEDKHGAGSAQSTGFRQFQAEYQASFPAQHYDSVRELGEILTAFEGFATSIEVQASTTGRLLITGAAGTGKTHSACDVARVRAEEGLFSVLLFGVRFRSGIVWDQIRLQLGLGAHWTEHALFDALDAAAESTGGPLVLFIDALNESQPRTIWRTELGALSQALSTRPHLRLCVTCRTDYAFAVIDQSSELPRFEHPGFAGVEFDACQAFFEHYGLEPPIGPLFDPEFSNPLFLKLTCEVLRASRQRRLPAGWTGFRALFRAILDHQDREWHAETGSLTRNELTISMEAIASELASSSRRSLPLHEASQIVTRLGANGDAVVRRLLEQELLMRVPVEEQPEGGVLTELREEVAFAYERLGDHLQVQAALRVAPSGALSSQIIQFALDEPGYAQALSIQLPETRVEELFDVVPEENHGRLFRPWLMGLEWRDLNAITERTQHWLRVFLNKSKGYWVHIYDALLVLAMRPGHRLDGWLGTLLLEAGQPDRDSFWCTYLHVAWEERGSLHPVRRLTSSAWNLGSASLADDLGASWLRVLCWFFAAADRRVRDHASRAAVRIGEARPELWVRTCSEMLGVDDDYVVERVLACAFGTHLRVRDDDALRALAEVVVPVLAESVRANALIRDHARCICDLALRRSLQVTFSPDIVQLRTSSEWPLKIPAGEDFARFQDVEVRRQYPNLYESTIDTYRGDFAIYTVPYALRAYEHAIKTPEACRWILQHVLDLGYTPERFRNYDAYMIGKFGGGRARPKWAERIGKKYQWIALGRLLGRLADHVSAKREEWQDSVQIPLVARKLRDLDVSIDGRPCAEEDQHGREQSDLMSGHSESDEEWVVDTDDIYRIEDSLWSLRAAQGEAWYPLEANVAFVDSNERPDDKGFRRQVWVQVRSYLVPTGDFQRLWNWARSKNFMGRWMPEGWTIGDNVFLGEYPGGISLGDKGLPDRAAVSPDGIRCAIIPTTHDVHAEFTEDSSTAHRYALNVPVPQLLAGLHWNGRGGYVNDSGELLFLDPSAEGGSPSGCFVRKEHMQSYLDRTGMSLVWTVLAEKLPGNYEVVRRLDYSHIRGLHEGTVRVARDPVLARS